VDRVISHVQRFVEKKKVLRRVRLLADHIEVVSRLWFVKIITTSIAEVFDIDTKECVRGDTMAVLELQQRLTRVLINSAHKVQVSKRDYEVYNCGPELLEVPSWNEVANVLQLQNP
jgi:hypothetical protein